jgi:hypothetical protein
MTSGNYSQNTPSFLAIQWLNGTDGGEDFDTFIANFSSGPIFSVNEDGSLHYVQPGGTGDIPLGMWLIHGPYWGTAPTSMSFSEYGNIWLDNDDFTAQFTAQ